MTARLRVGVRPGKRVIIVGSALDARTVGLHGRAGKRQTKSPARGRAFLSSSLGGDQSSTASLTASLRPPTVFLHLAGDLIGLAFGLELAVAGHFASDFLDFAFGLFGRTFNAIFVHRCPHFFRVGSCTTSNARTTCSQKFRHWRKAAAASSAAASWHLRNVSRFEDRDDLVRARIDDDDLVADQDVVVAAPFRIDLDHFHRQRIEMHAVPGSRVPTDTDTLRCTGARLVLAG